MKTVDLNISVFKCFFTYSNSNGGRFPLLMEMCCHSVFPANVSFLRSPRTDIKM